jgi:SpoIIAA-like
MSATATNATVQRSTRRTGLEPGALWEDAKLGFAHMFDWDRFAVVTDLESISRTTKFMAMLMPMEGRVYPMAEAAKAREWISET